MEKKTLYFKADNQSLVGQNVPARLASDTVSYIEAVFDLGENWSGFDAVKAVWSTDFDSLCTVLDSSGACVVPHEVLERVGNVWVNLVGSISEDETLTDRLTTYPVKAITVDANAAVCGSETSPITPSQFDQFVEAVRSDADRAEDGATAAAASALAAAASATSASGSATDASQSASGAALSAQSASESAGSAAQSATSASESAADAEEAKDAILNMTATATTLPEGSQATVDYNNGVMAFGIPRGDKGAKGDKGETGETGATPNLSIGTVETLEPDEDATATITGTAKNPVLNLGLPKGETGEVSLLELIANTKVDEATDSVPYQTRTLSRVGSHESLRKIVGGTVAWNQLLEHGNFDVVTGWSGAGYGAITVANNIGNFTLSDVNNSARIERSFVPTVGHKILVTIDIKVPYATGVFSTFQAGSYAAQIGRASLSVNTWTTVAGIRSVEQADTTSGKVRFYVGDTSASVGDVVQFRNGMIIDLTQMFGTTIADYVYSIDQATAGAGVAWFRKLFPKDYYPYDKGTLRSVEGVSAHETVGFNQWDEELELGDISASTGENTSNTSVIRTKNYIPVLPKTVYFAKFGTATGYAVRSRFYDADKNYIGASAYGGAQVQYNQPFTTPENARYMRFTPQSAYGTTYNHDICINLSDPTRNGEYEPYVKHSYALDSDLELRGIPKLDASNNLYYDGDEYEADGTVNRRYGIVDLGTLNWLKDTFGSKWGFYLSAGVLPDAKVVQSLYALPNFINAKYMIAPTYGNESYNTEKIMFQKPNGQIFVVDSSYTEVADFKAAMSGTMLVYELATPTTETASPYTEIQSVESGGSEEFVGAEIPVGHESIYPRTLADTMPTQDGSYSLSLTVSGGKPSVEWEVNA